MAEETVEKTLDQTFAEALAELNSAAALPAEDRNQKRTRKLKVDLAILGAQAAAVRHKAQLDEDNRSNKASVNRRLTEEIAKARAALKP